MAHLVRRNERDGAEAAELTTCKIELRVFSTAGEEVLINDFVWPYFVCEYIQFLLLCSKEILINTYMVK